MSENTEREKFENLHATTPQLEEVLAFLYGAGDMDGASFSEVPAGKPRYWWRAKLREAIKVEAEAIRRAALEEAAAMVAARAEWAPCDCGCPSGKSPESVKDVELIRAAAAIRKLAAPVETRAGRT